VLVGELSEIISVDFSTAVSVILMKAKDEDKLLDRSKSKGERKLSNLGNVQFLHKTTLRST